MKHEKPDGRAHCSAPQEFNEVVAISRVTIVNHEGKIKQIQLVNEKENYPLFAEKSVW
jgi:hypothetical protein